MVESVEAGSVEFPGFLKNTAMDNVICVHYGKRKFDYRLPTDFSKWTNMTFLDLINFIQQKYAFKDQFILYEKIANDHLIIDDIDDLIAVFENESSDDSENDDAEKDQMPHIYIKVNASILIRFAKKANHPHTIDRKQMK